MHALTGKAIATVVFLAVAVAIITGIGMASGIPDGSFEGTLADNWVLYEYPSSNAYHQLSTDRAQEGTHSIKFHDFYNEVYCNIVMKERIHLVNGDKIIWYSYGNGVNMGCNLNTHNPDAGYVKINNVYSSSYLAANSWQKHEYTWNQGTGDFCLGIQTKISSQSFYDGYVDNVTINGIPWSGYQPPNYNLYEVSITDSITSGLVEGALSCFYDVNSSTWTNYTATTGQHYANLTANHTYNWYVIKTGYETYEETFMANYANGYTVIKSCVLINLGEPSDPALTYVTFRVTANSRLTNAVVALDDGQSKLTDYDGVAFFVVPKYEDYNYVVKYTGYYPKYGVFNLSSSTLIDVTLTPMAGASPTPTPGSGQLPDFDLGSIEDLTELYKDLVNASIDKSLNRTYEAFNDTAGWYFMQLNDSASTWHQFFIDQYETPTGYGYVYYDLLDLIFSFIPAQVKAQLAYYFLWIFFLILLGR